MVGAVVVCNDIIIGEGFHCKYGEPHAEVNAIRSVENPNLLKQSTLYVNLEPCSFHGKTPPCTDLIIESQIPRVVIGSSDPNPQVAGQGVSKMRQTGIDVIENVLEKECDFLNVRYMTYHKKKRPYVLLKWAQTIDGYIDIIRDGQGQGLQPGRPTQITGWYDQTLVHKWRTEEQAIMVGTNTAMVDNPFLNVRNWNGPLPLRITIDRQLRLPNSLNLFDGSQPTLVFTEKECWAASPAPTFNNVTYVTIPFDDFLPANILNELYKRKVISLLIEGGTQLLQSFIKAGLWDETRILTGKKIFGNGVKAPFITINDHLTV